MIEKQNENENDPGKVYKEGKSFTIPHIPSAVDLLMFHQTEGYSRNGEKGAMPQKMKRLEQLYKYVAASFKKNPFEFSTNKPPVVKTNKPHQVKTNEPHQVKANEPHEVKTYEPRVVKTYEPRVVKTYEPL